MTVKLTTQPERRSKQAFDAFCSEMRQRSPYCEIVWDNDTWIVGHGRRASARMVERLHFTRHGYASQNDGPVGDGFEEPFATFAKAVIVWRAINAKERPTALSQMVLVRAFRYLYEELLKSERRHGTRVSPINLKPYHFSAAKQIVVGREAAQSGYRIANYLRYIADLVDRKALTVSPLRWTHDVPRPDTSGGLGHDRVGKAFDDRRKKHLLSDEVVFAVADISKSSELQPGDAIRQRLTDLLFCAGFRINECLVLLRDAKVEEEVRDDLGHLARDTSGNPLPPHFGLRFTPEKEGEHVTRVKWLPTELAPIARKAFEELLDRTAEFAKDAEFAYLNPGRVRLGEPWDSMPDETQLCLDQISQMVGLASKNSAYSWVKRYVGDSPKRGELGAKKGEVERAIRSRIGSMEVLIGGVVFPLHKLLAVVPVNYFHSRKAVIRGSATLVSDQNISDYLGGRSSSRGSVKSIFQRLDRRLENGKHARITTHQFRHFLDTLAATGGVSDLVRAGWMGRKDISQNSAYDHESGISLAKKIRIRLLDGEVLGPIAEAAGSVADPVAREAAADDLIRAVHKTLLGRCFHDWASSPCPESEACWSCDEHLLIKGDALELAEADRQLAEALRAISVAEAELSAETYGVNNWLASHVRKRDQLRRIVEVHRDPSIPDGTIIHLRKDEIVLTQNASATQASS